MRGRWAVGRAAWCIALAGGVAAAAAGAQQPAAILRLSVTGGGVPLVGARVAARATSVRTDSAGLAILRPPAGPVVVTVEQLGFVPDTLSLHLRAGVDTSIAVDLHALVQMVPAVIVTSTRVPRRLQDEPLRVEVLGGDDISEKNEMRPGDLSTLLSELSGVRMQRLSPALGATNIRLDGLPGRYTLVLEDGLPLFGTLTSGFSLVEQPPLDLRQAEVIKGAASSLYGPAALGGVVDLISRQPPDTSQLLVNGASEGGADVLGFDARQLAPRVGLTVLGGAHYADAADPDHDGWTDVPGLRRVEVRPRLFYHDRAGRTFMVTAGAFDETRAGGALVGRTPLTPPLGLDSLATKHADVGATGHIPISRALSVAFRASASWESRRRAFSGAIEHDGQESSYGEVSVTAVGRRQTFVAGVAWQRDRYSNREVPWADVTSSTPGAFAQETFAPAPWFSSTLDGRCDDSNLYGTICTPRASLLFRPRRALAVRVSLGSGWSGPLAMNDATDAIGLTHVIQPGPLAAEHATTASVDVTATRGPLQLNATLFDDAVAHPVGLARVPGDTTGLVQLVNAAGALRTHGAELYAVYNEEPFVVTAYFAATRSRERSPSTGRIREVPYVPREAAGLDAALEDDDAGRYLAMEIFYTGRQALQDDPYLGVSPPYTTVGVLAAQRFGRTTVFANAENLTDIRQSRFEPMGLPTVGEGGQWSVNAWGPLDGRRFNVGIRYAF